MKLKRPSLKGMKNTNYLGHFAKDEYIQKGHNFSGRVPMMASGPSQIQSMGPSNPFDVAGELKNREAQVAAQQAALEAAAPDLTPEIAGLQTQLEAAQKKSGSRNLGEQIVGTAQSQSLSQQLEREKARTRQAVGSSYRASRNKFLGQV